MELTLQSVSPNAGPTTGGTEVTIRGRGFAAGASLTVAGLPATDVTVHGTDTLTAKTPASPVAAPADIVIALGGRTHRLAGAFTYEPMVPNTAPVIKSIAAQGKRPRQPAAFADYRETIQITVVVEDAEKAAAELVYEWRACGGTFSGTGPQVDWTAGNGTLPTTCTIDVTVIDGPHAVTRSIAVRLHNSITEVGELAREFLEEFANNLIPAATTVRNFSDSCPGKRAELDDVTFIRDTRKVESSAYGTATVTVDFGSRCHTQTADACVLTPVEWRSTVKESGLLEIAKGTSIITGIYRDSRWWLCDSLYQGGSSLGLRFVR